MYKAQVTTECFILKWKAKVILSFVGTCKTATEQRNWVCFSWLPSPWSSLGQTQGEAVIPCALALSCRQAQKQSQTQQQSESAQEGLLSRVISLVLTLKWATSKPTTKSGFNHQWGSTPVLSSYEWLFFITLYLPILPLTLNKKHTATRNL